MNAVLALQPDPVSASAIEVAKNVLAAEAAGLRALAASLDASFEAAVDRLAACTGRVVLSGMGKSGLVARKIAATLASTGAPALFVHPAEASHGDLGMIVPGDAVLALSNSGETSELADSHYTVVRAVEDSFKVATEPVEFTRVRPGQSLLPQAAE